jgi:general stress protein CsbA
MLCKQCGNLIWSGDRVCRSCGKYQDVNASDSFTFEPVPIEYIDIKKTPAHRAIGIVGFRITQSILTACMVGLFILTINGNPANADSPRDFFFDRAIVGCIIFFALILPCVLVLLWSFRAKISFMQYLMKWHLALIILAMFVAGAEGAFGIAYICDNTWGLAKSNVTVETQVSDSENQAAVIAPTEVQITETTEEIQEETAAPTEIELPGDLEAVLSGIGISASAITVYASGDEAAGDSSYAFYYKNTRFSVCFDTDDTVASISLGDLTLYRRGYEPLSADDYIVDADTKRALQTKVVFDIPAKLAAPESADFPMLDWSIGHSGDTYFVSGVVSAQVDGTEKRDIPFRAEYESYGETYALVYLELDGKIVVGSGSVLEIPETKPLASER